VSSHLEIYNTTGATIYASKLLGAEYPHQTFDEGNAIVLGNITLKALNTPGHSPDSISIVALDDNGKENAVFTGDTLFIGDCGRPDLREQAGAITATRAELAKQMFHSLRNKLMTLPDDVFIYPAHGAGSLCGKGLSDQNSSTIGAEKKGNWSLQNLSEQAFVKELLSDQPFLPKYFPFDVGINKKGADSYATSILNVQQRETITSEEFANLLNPDILIIDTRPQEQFKKTHFKNAINLMNDIKFETWLGSIVNPNEPFYLIAENVMVLNQLIKRTSKIGYEKQIVLAFVMDYGNTEMNVFDSDNLIDNEDAFTIVDIRNHSEVKNNKIFTNAIHIPLHELRERTNEIPLHKPIVVHCAGGYRSAAGSSIIKSKLNGTSQVFDLSEAVKQFQK
jgi:rhodanese-related sulfurtransferase